MYEDWEETEQHTMMSGWSKQIFAKRFQYTQAVIRG